jgi:hypothetical protein
MGKYVVVTTSVLFNIYQFGSLEPMLSMTRLTWRLCDEGTLILIENDTDRAKLN